MAKVFITNATGCVGSYLVDALSPDYELYLLVRNSKRLPFNPDNRSNVHIITGSMDSVVQETELLAQMDYCIHNATAWGGPDMERINVQRVHELFNLLDPARVRRIVYFSTASILGRDNHVLPEAEIYGTDYIKTKYLCYSHLRELPLYDRITTVFPTLIFGGDANHSFSNLTLALPLLRRFSWLIGHIKLNFAFHFIHARDIAVMIRHFMEMPNPGKEYVLGNEALLFGEFSKRAAKFFGHPVHWQIPLSPKKLFRLAILLGAEMSEWDRFCLEYQNFTYRTVNCETFALPTAYNTIESVLADGEFVEKKR